MGEEAALWGGGEQYCLVPDCQDERVSNLLDTSRESLVSNNEVEKFGIPLRMHSHAMLLLKDLL